MPSSSSQQSIIINIIINYPVYSTNSSLSPSIPTLQHPNQTIHHTIKMQFTTTLLAALLSTAASAAPALAARTVPSLTFQISNDLSGRHASATVLGDGLARNLIDLFRGSAVDNSGAIVGTSAQLTHGFTDATRCFFQNGNTVINFNGTKTFVELDQKKDQLLEVYLNGFNVQCV